MKILMINTSDNAGGAAIAAFRLHESLLRQNINSQMLVENKNSACNSVIEFQENKLKKNIGKFLRKIVNKFAVLKYKKTKTRKYGSFSVQKAGNSQLVKKINELNPDIVHLHWICKDFLSVEDIAKIKSPIVWSLHDIWAFSGGCHCVCNENADLCKKYTENCGNCGHLGSKKLQDLSFAVLQRKKRTFANKNMTIIGLSGWMADCAKSSAVFADKTVVNLPNPFDTTVFKPLPKEECRDFWKLPKDKKLILFGAVSATSRVYKGFSELIEALHKIKTENVECVVFGANEPQNPPKLPCKINYLGNVNNDIDLIKLYSACDITIVPSWRENLSNVIMESMACGTPAAGFAIGGNSDMIEHRINGWLATPFDTSDLAAGIDWILNSENHEILQKNARKKIVQNFDYSIVTEKYLNLYNKIL